MLQTTGDQAIFLGVNRKLETFTCQLLLGAVLFNLFCMTIVVESSL